MPRIELLSFLGGTFVFRALSTAGVLRSLSLETDTIFALVVLLALELVVSLLIFGVFVPPFFNKSPSSPSFKGVVDGISGFFCGWAVCHAVAVLYGAPIFDQFAKTALWSGIVSSLVFVPVACQVGPSLDGFVQFLGLSRPLSVPESLCYAPTLATIVGAWAGAIPMPLDWDRPWQAWPVSCTYGALLGQLVGLVLAAVLVMLNCSVGAVRTKR
eukprot:TRINITY_DN22347_c0_g1_i1.p1 TRINITY_DN22347_c0_g1~~TRINITY_DN22347_c0_g1_i1.p1  ORF type:complete len:214 (+),score=5.33 TRINITY_DN22347_c0_g1_i1:65-706(+)